VRQEEWWSGPRNVQFQHARELNGFVLVVRRAERSQ